MTRQQIGDMWVDVDLNEQDIDEIQSHTPGVGTEHLYRTTDPPYARTGDLKAGFVLDIATGDIVNAVPYAGYVELGTSKMAGHFMVQQSVPAILRRLDRDIAQQIGDGPQPLFTLPELVMKIG